MTHEPNDPHWLRLAATLRAEPAPSTLARVHARLAQRGAGEPAWLRWLARPAVLAMSAAVLAISMLSGLTWIATKTAPLAASDASTFTSVFVGDVSSFGLPLSTADDAATDGSVPADPQEARR